jgi:arylformamidase
LSTAADRPPLTGATAAEQRRVEFDADVVFSNGGSLTARGFRFDIPGTQISDAQLGELLVAQLGLLMVGRVIVSRKQIIVEPHKGLRGTENTNPGRRVLDLMGADTTVYGRQPAHLELVDLPVTVVRIRNGNDQVIDRVQLMPFAVAGGAVLVDAGENQARLTGDAARWLAQQGALVVGGDLEFPLTELAGVTVLSGLVQLGMLPPKSARLHVLHDVDGRLAGVYAITSGSRP